MTAPSDPCARCGQTHTGCAGHNRAGNACGKDPMKGTTVCRSHGGASPQVRAAAARRLERAEAEALLRRSLAEAYGEQAPEIDPAEAMLRMVSWKYAEVVALRAVVAQLEQGEFVWGVTREKEGGDDEGVTREARPSAWLSLLHETERDLVKFAAAARAAGCDERRVQLAEDQGALVAEGVKRIVGAFLAALLSLLEGVPAARDLVAERWGALVAEIVPRELRALGGPDRA